MLKRLLYRTKPVIVAHKIPRMQAFEEFKFHGRDIWIIPNFMGDVLKLPEHGLLETLINSYPIRIGEEEIPLNTAQWIAGSHKALNYRGHAIKRSKMWIQKENPIEKGFYWKYYYTGWQWKVLPATFGWEACPEIKIVWEAYDKFCVDINSFPATHSIVTKYVDKNDCIGDHFDKPKSIQKESLITVIKLGPNGRLFTLKDDHGHVIFNELIHPGSAVIMTLEENLKTKHAVPKMEDECGLSGSIVFRTIQESCAISTPRLIDFK